MGDSSQVARMLPPPIFGDPVIQPEEIRSRVAAIVLEADQAARARSKKLKDADRDSLVAHFMVSEECIGPVSGPAVAGWFRRHLKIIPKVGVLQPFIVNPVQWSILTEACLDLQAGRLVRYIILKARQFGVSTFIQAFMFFLALRISGLSATTIAHKDEASMNLFQMTIRFLRYMRTQPKLKRDTLSQIEFASPHESRLMIESAEAEEAKRSFTNHLLHCSEVAFWPHADRTNTSIMQTVPEAPWTCVFKESTANGIGGVFYDDYWAAKKKTADSVSSARALFYPWFVHPEYRMNVRESQRSSILASLNDEEKRGVDLHAWSVEQLAWRRKMIEDACGKDVSKFHQEYPSTDREAFLVSGRPVFDLNMIEERMELARCAPIGFQGHLVYDVENKGA